MKKTYVPLQVLEASAEQHVPVLGESEPKAIRMRFPFLGVQRRVL